MPVVSMSKKVSAKPLILDEPKKVKLSVKFAKNEESSGTQSKLFKKITSVNIEKATKKSKTNDKKMDVTAQKKFTAINSEEVVKRKTTKTKTLKHEVPKSKANENVRANSEMAKAEPTNSVCISVSRSKPIFNPILKGAKKLSNIKPMKPVVWTRSKVAVETIKKRTAAGANDVQEVKKELGRKSMDLKKESGQTRKAENKIEAQKKNMRKVIADIETELRLKSEKFEKQKEISQRQKSKKEKLDSSKDVDNKKPNKNEQKKKRSALPPTAVEFKGSKSIFAKTKSETVKGKQKVQKKNKTKNIEVKKPKQEKVEQKPVKLEENIKKEKLTSTSFTLDKLSTLETEQVTEHAKSMLQSALRYETLRLIKEPAPPVVPRPDLLKFVQAMKENVQFESLHPGTESYQDLVHNTLKSVFSTVNKFPRKDPNDPFVSMNNFVKTTEREAPAEKHKSKLSAAAQMFQRRAECVQTTQPLERALKESQFAEVKFLEKRKTQTQPEKSKFLTSLHVGPKVIAGNKEENANKGSKEDLKNVPSDIVDPLTPTYDTKAVKMAQRYSNQLEEARLELSRRLNAL